MWAVMVQHINPSSCNLSRWWREVKLHVIDLKEQHPYSLDRLQHPMLLHFTSQETFLLLRVVVGLYEKMNVYCT